MKRHHTLFNLYAFAEHMTNHGSVPTLNIINCEFEYFLKDYDSLIHVETTNLNEGYLSGGNIKFYMFSSIGREKGAKISIRGSKFSNSRFCRGMIVYRKANYISNQYGFTNKTHLYMTDKTIAD